MCYSRNQYCFRELLHWKLEKPFLALQLAVVLYSLGQWAGRVGGAISQDLQFSKKLLDQTPAFNTCSPFPPQQMGPRLLFWIWSLLLSVMTVCTPVFFFPTNYFTAARCVPSAFIFFSFLLQHQVLITSGGKVLAWWTSDMIQSDKVMAPVISAWCYFPDRNRSFVIVWKSTHLSPEVWSLPFF